MATRIVKQGDCFSSLAAEFGMSSWEDLYNLPGNAELIKKRPNPNILAPGDQVAVPDTGPGKFVPVATGSMHPFVLKLQEVKLRIVIVDRKGKPYDVQKFQVTVGAKKIDGTSAPGGLVEVKVPATAPTAHLRVWVSGDSGDDPTIDRDVSIGHIDPIELLSGVQGRLSNLGYKCVITDSSNTEVDDLTLAAVRSFRAAQGLPEVEPPTEDDDTNADYVEKLLDPDFRTKLQAAYEGSAA
jgi:N-acetylmuramoyl-L-alanine amidase